MALFRTFKKAPAPITAIEETSTRSVSLLHRPIIDQVPLVSTPVTAEVLPPFQPRAAWIRKHGWAWYPTLLRLLFFVLAVVVFSLDIDELNRSQSIAVLGATMIAIVGGICCVMNMLLDRGDRGDPSYWIWDRYAIYARRQNEQLKQHQQRAIERASQQLQEQDQRKLETAIQSPHHAIDRESFPHLRFAPFIQQQDDRVQIGLLVQDQDEFRFEHVQEFAGDETILVAERWVELEQEAAQQEASDRERVRTLIAQDQERRARHSIEQEELQERQRQAQLLHQEQLRIEQESKYQREQEAASLVQAFRA